MSSAARFTWLVLGAVAVTLILAAAISAAIDGGNSLTALAHRAAIRTAAGGEPQPADDRGRDGVPATAAPAPQPTADQDEPEPEPGDDQDRDRDRGGVTTTAVALPTGSGGRGPGDGHGSSDGRGPEGGHDGGRG